jgi:muconate cycloisomerase
MGGIRAEVIPYALEFRDPYVTARGTLAEREMALLRLHDADGVTGLGEAVPLSLRGGASLPEVIADLRRWAEDPGEVPEEMSAPAACAVRTAMLDLESRRAGVPAWEALGAERPEPVPCNATLPAGRPEEIAERAEEWAAEGFGTFKLKVGVPGETETVAAVRKRLPAAARIRVDANAAWSAEAAIVALGSLAQYSIELAEQPVDGLVALAHVRRAVPMPIAADESVNDEEEARQAAEAAACDMATVKLSKVGGHQEALRIAAQLPVYLSSALDGPVGIAAAGHVAQALRSAGDAGVAHGLATQRLFRRSIAAVGPELRDGHLHLPPGPGLGVELDEEALERHRL